MEPQIPPKQICLTGRKKILAIAKDAGTGWYKHNALQLAAALSYYTLFSLGPILLLATAIAGALFGTEAAHGELLHQMSGLMGAESAKVIEKILASTRYPTSNVLASIIGMVALLIGATGVFIELKSDLDRIWEVAPDPKRSGIWNFLRERFLSFALVVAVGFLLLVSLVVSAVLAAMDKYFSSYGLVPPWSMQVFSALASFVLVTLLFAMIFRVLPSVWLRWREVWLGAAITALLFNIGKVLIGFYLGRSAVASAYGASASVIVLLVWTYYSSAILFLGAEVTRAVATREDNYGKKVAMRLKNAKVCPVVPQS